LEKEFVLTDSTVNCYGFRLLTSGYLISEYKKNPIGYAMHKRDDGVLVRWEDLRVDGDTVYGKPVINLSHAMGQRTVDEIENGFLNAASVGHIVVLETSEEASLKLDGQVGPTVTKWYNRECSLVDVPGNYNALKQLVDSDDQPISNLSDFTKTKLATNMKQIIFSGTQIAALKLKADASETEVANAFTDLVAKAEKADDYKTQLTNLQAAVNKSKITDLLAGAVTANKITKDLSDKLEKDYAHNPEGLKNLIDAMPVRDTVKVKDLINGALSDKKITKELGDKLEKDYANNPEGLKNLIDAMPAYKPLEKQLNASTVAGFTEDELKMDWDGLFEAGLTARLKAENPEIYKVKFKEAHGVEPNM
jgi:plasmid maintenance system antidote protein VapI